MARTIKDKKKDKKDKREKKENLNKNANESLNKKANERLKQKKLSSPPIIKQLPIKKSSTKLRSHVLKEIKYYQNSFTNLISKSTFINLVKRNVKDQDIRFSKESLLMLQDAFESFIVSVVESSYLATFHAKRVTLKAIDIALQKKIKEMSFFK